MFKKFNDIEKRFQKIRLTALLVVLGSVLPCCWIVYESYVFASESSQRIYVMAGGNVFQASAAEERYYLPIDARNHVRDFHELLFNLDPDEKTIRAAVGKALYLADGSAKQFWDNLQESGFVTGMISANMTERVRVDSVVLEDAADPYLYHFICVAKLTLTRASTTTVRNLLSQGWLRKVHRSEENAHGFLIEGFEVGENKDLQNKNH